MLKSPLFDNERRTDIKTNAIKKKKKIKSFPLISTVKKDQLKKKKRAFALDLHF